MVADAAAEEALNADKEGRAEVEQALADMEREVQKEIATSGIRVPTAEALKQLLVAGNTLVHAADDSDSLDIYTLREYVVQRDRSDKVLAIVLCEEVSPLSLEPDLRELALQAPEAAESFGAGVTPSALKSVRIYTKIWLGEDGRYYEHQELAGRIIDGTRGSYLADEMPWLALRWTRVQGESYGRSLLNEYDGPIRSIEILTTSLLKGSVAAARVIPLVNPNGFLDPEDINNAEDGEFVFGTEDDLSFAQLNKFADFSVARAELEDLRKDMSAVFLLNVARQAERVTAEEIRLFANELEGTHAGTFTLMAAEFQLPVIRRKLRRLEKRGVIGKLSAKLRDHIKPAIVSGVDALGRSQDLDKMAMALRSLQGVIDPTVLQQYTNPGKLIAYALMSAGVDIPDAVKSDEDVKQEQAAAQQQAQMGSLIEQAGKNPEMAQQIIAQLQGANQ
jgi:hypothetical protein